MHGWGSNFMVAIVLIHMGAGLPLWSVQISTRAYLDHRCVFLLLMTLGMAFSGQVLRFDQERVLGGWEIGASHRELGCLLLAQKYRKK